MFPKSSLIIYLIVSSLVFLVIIWLFNFYIFSKFAEILSEEMPLEIKETKDKIFALAIGVSVFIFLFDLFIFKVDRNLSEEEKKVETILETNPKDQFAQNKLKQIRKKRIIYSFLIESVFTIVLGIVVGLFALNFVQPLYKFLGNIK